MHLSQIFIKKNIWKCRKIFGSVEKIYDSVGVRGCWCELRQEPECGGGVWWPVSPAATPEDGGGVGPKLWRWQYFIEMGSAQIFSDIET